MHRPVSRMVDVVLQEIGGGRKQALLRRLAGIQPTGFVDFGSGRMG